MAKKLKLIIKPVGHTRPTIREVPLLQQFEGMKQAEFVQKYGSRGERAILVAEDMKVFQYNDFIVVEGKTANYVIEEDLCTCPDCMFRHKACYHLLAAGLARENGLLTFRDAWYAETGHTAVPVVAAVVG